MSSYSGKAFRRSTFQYIGGRVVNALIGFFVFAWVARYLPEQHYANYIAAFACVELGLVIFGFGMEWVTAVFIPKVRLEASGMGLRRFVMQCVLLQALLLGAGALLLWLLASDIAQWFDFRDAEAVFRLYAIVMFVEGLGRMLRDQVLSCLLLQGAAQASQMARNIMMFTFALTLSGTPQWQTASALGIAEILASSVSLMMSAALLMVFLRRVRREPATSPDWTPPPWSSLLRTGGNAWLSNMANLTWSGQVVLLLSSRLAGVEFTAALGFARNLAEQIRRYLPMEFLLGIVRTLLISRFAVNGNREQLALRAALMYRANLLFLLPVLCVALVHGDAVCAFLSKGRYASAHWLLVGWLAVLIFWAHHRVTDLMVHTMGHSDRSRRASQFLLVVPVLLAFAANAALWPVVFGLLAVAEMMYSVVVLAPLRIYRLNWRALAKMGIGCIVAIAALAIPAWPVTEWWLLAQLGLSFVAVAMITAMLQGWSPAEKSTLMTLGKSAAP